jgi:hypothetical protein
MKMNTTLLKGIYIPDHFWDEYAEKLNAYNMIIINNYESGKITLKDKCKAQQNVDELFADFYIESVKLI